MCYMPSRDKQPFERLVRWRIVAKVDSIGLLVRMLAVNDVDWYYIDLRNSQQNGFIESFNGSLRDELLKRSSKR